MDACRSHSPVSELVRAIAVIVSAFAAATPAAAQMEWNGTQSQHWTNDANWTPVGPPGMNDDVTIDLVHPHNTWISGANVTARGIDVGPSNSGWLIIINGGTLDNSGSAVSIGRFADSFGRVTVQDPGSTWTNGSNLFVGMAGEGELRITGGGQVSTSQTSVGLFDGSVGDVRVAGAGSVWNHLGSELRVAQTGTGTVSVENGGVINSPNGVLAVSQEGQGTVTVSGNGSAWTMTGNLTVGFNGTGALTIEDQGFVGNVIGILGDREGASGAVTVTGVGSEWNNSASLTIGDAGAGELMIEDGGMVVTSSHGIIGNSGQTEGTVLVIGADSTWNVGGDLTVGRHNLASAKLTIGTGALVAVGDEVLVASAAQPGGCDCVLRVDGLLSAAAGTIIYADSRLEGAGMIGGGSVTIAGTVAPGNPVGVLSMRGLILEPTAVLEFDLDEPGGAGDRISAGGPGGDLTLDGTLHVADLGGFGEGIYILIEYSGTLIDNTLVIGSLPAGFTATVDTSSAGQVNLVVAQLPDDIFDDRFEP